MKKSTIYYSLLMACILLVSGCSRAQGIVEDPLPSAQNKNILVVYLSRTKNTKAVAEMIHQKLGSDLVALELETPYPEDYRKTVEQVANENANGFLPALKTKIDSINKYDVVFVGFPTWGMQLPPPVKSFLTQYNFSSKTIVPFNTNAGYGVGSSFETVWQLCTGSKFLEGYTTKGGIERDGVLFVMQGEKQATVQSEVDAWLRNIGMLHAVN